MYKEVSSRVNNKIGFDTAQLSREAETRIKKL
jgi:hypothetical protein